MKMEELDNFELDPCPFCGGTEIVTKTEHIAEDNTWMAYCECQHCAARGSNYSHVDSEEEAIEDAEENWHDSCSEGILDKYVLRPAHRFIIKVDQIMDDIAHKATEDEK
jgi:hypothetical protein